jgi:hypothetical protein
MKECPRCSTEHNKPGIYCCRSCANVRNHNEDTKKKIGNSVKLRGIKNNHNQNKITLICTNCKSEYQVWPCDVNRRKYCSRNCCNLDPNKKVGPGGYRPGSGRSKSGYYKGIYCGSTYELCWAIWALDNGVKFTRFSGILDDGETKYIPDFLLDDGKTIIELKGYEHTDAVDVKTKLAERLGYTVEILRKTDLKEMFDHVYEKYGTKEYHRLYDDYKPSYEYQCGYCGDLVRRDKKNKTVNVYCNALCSMRGNRKLYVRDRHTTSSSPEEIKEKYRIQHNTSYKEHHIEINNRRRELYKLKKINNTVSSSKG